MLVACSSSDDTSERAADSAATTTAASATTVPTTVPATTAPPSSAQGLDVAGCPVSDEVFCATAVEVVDALAAGDAAALVGLSRVDRIECADMNVAYVPGCATAAVLEGHGLSDASLVVDVVGDRAYQDWLTALTANLDVAYEDDLGTGAVEVIGIGTCGPDEPGRRTYHVAWTAGLRVDDASAERVLGSFELTFVDDWRIALSYLGSLEDWEAAQPAPLDDAFCEAGRSPWRG